MLREAPGSRSRSPTIFDRKIFLLREYAQLQRLVVHLSAHTGDRRPGTGALADSNSPIGFDQAGNSVFSFGFWVCRVVNRTQYS